MPAYAVFDFESSGAEFNLNSIEGKVDTIPLEIKENIGIYGMGGVGKTNLLTCKKFVRRWHLLLGVWTGCNYKNTNRSAQI